MLNVSEAWAHPNPIFLDFETQSECDIKESGGRVYSEHPSTRVLILSMFIDGTFHTWIPDHIKVDTRTWVESTLWPYQMKPAMPVKLHRGPAESFLKAIEFDRIKSRPFVAHNAFGFDRYIWNRFIKQEVTWLDSMLLAKTAGRTGRLDSLGKAVLGQGKDHAKKLMKVLCTAKKSIFGYAYPMIKNGDLQAFTRYANGDVELLRRLWDEFADVSVEADVIEVHDTVNKRGVYCDRELLSIVERLMAYSTSQAVTEIERLTRGKLNAGNLKSGPQVHAWLDTFGISLTDEKGKPCLRKELIQKYIDSPYIIEEHLTAATEIPPIVIDVLKLRMKALRITEAKVKKAQSRVSADGRIRDLFAYHQAHTGRWSSSGVQIHNLPRPVTGIPEQMEQLLAEKWNGSPYILPLDRKQEDMRTLFDSIKSNLPGNLTVDDLCSGLLRLSFMGQEKRDKAGNLLKRKVLCLVDYAQVEARGLAWIADEQKMNNAFLEGRDIYREFAASMFGVPLDAVTKDMRQVAKSAVLGCIAEDTPVLTDSGWKKIQDITCADMVWDGTMYVRHNGVVDKGIKRCLQVESVWLTPDHKVLSSQDWQEASDVINGNILLAKGIYSENGKFNLKSKNVLTTELESSIYVNANAEHWRKWNVTISLPNDQHNVTNVQSSHQEIHNHIEVYLQTINIENDYLTVSPQSWGDALIKRTNNIKTTVGGVSVYIHNGLRTAGYSLPISLRYQDGTTRNLKLIESKTMKGINPEISDSQHEKNNVITSGKQTSMVLKRTYDILNCGPHNRFQAGPMIVHNCGYGLGADKFRVYAANMGADLAKAGVTAEQCVNAYRDTYTKIAGWKPDKLKSYRVGGVWKALDDAVKRAVVDRTVTEAGRCRFLMIEKDLICILPSGRTLHYPNARLEDVIPPYCYTLGLPLVPKATIVYDSPRGVKSLYGGLITENVVQAICRDLLACAMVELEAMGIPVVLHVHDEIGCESEEEHANSVLRQMVSVMSNPPDWASGFPVTCEGFVNPRFAKSPWKGFAKLETKDLAL